MNIKPAPLIIPVCHTLRGESVPATDTPLVGTDHDEVCSWNEEDASVGFHGKVASVERTWILRFEVFYQSISPPHDVLQFGERQRVD
jgi:hypothetical protein